MAARLSSGHRPPSTGAGTNGFVVPFFRGSPNSQAGYWETFAAPFGAPGNLPDKPGTTTGAALTQTETNAFLTGSGNIYNLAGVNSLVLSDATPHTLGTVVVQMRTLGAEVEYASVSLNYTNATGMYALAPLSRIVLHRGEMVGLGSTVSSLWQWDLRGFAVSNYFISLSAAKPSLSLDSVTLDTWDQFVPLFTQPFSLNNTAPAIERWMYAHNTAPCDRPAGSTFGTLASGAEVDTRHAQHLVGWDTANLVATNRGPTQYLIRHCRITLTINRGNLFAYDPTQDDYRTYFETNHPAYLPDADAGRPMELFGVGFRNGFDAASFDQCAPFGTNSPGQRNAFAAGWSTNGALVDVSNNVGKTNEAGPPFEVAPFAVGQTTNAAPGELVPSGSKITFDLNLDDPFVLAYVRNGLNAGWLRFMLTSLHTTGGQFGAPSYPDFSTHFNEAVIDPTRLHLEGVVVGDSDVDRDALPDDWEVFYLNSLSFNATADPDGDGMTNLAELRTGTDPSRATNALRLSLDRSQNGVSVRLPHAANHRYSLEFTQDLQTWTNLTNVPVYWLGTNIVEWRDETPATFKRFYRVRTSTESQ